MEQNIIDLESVPEIQIKIEEEEDKNNDEVVEVDDKNCMPTTEIMKNDDQDEDEFEDASVWVDIVNSLSEVENQGIIKKNN